MAAVRCPRCGTRNRVDAMNCAVCNINLAFALEPPAEIEAIKRRDGESEDLHEAGGAATGTPKPLLLPALLLLGAFAFAFCLGEAAHELGHYLAHGAYGTEVGIKLDPFGGSRILGATSAPHETWGTTSAAGPLLNLLGGLTVWLALWRHRTAAILPFLLWGPIAFVQEGVTFSLGMLTPGGDAELIIESGVPAAFILGLGVLFLLSGIVAVCLVLPLVSLSPSDPFGRRFGVVAGGMVSFMLIRLLGSSVASPHLAQEQVIPLVFALVLAAVVVGVYGPAYSMLRRSSNDAPAGVPRPAMMSSVALALAMILFQMMSFN